MCKKILFVAAVVFAAVLAKADFLYWQVSNPDGYSTASLYAAKAGEDAVIMKTVLPYDFNESTLKGTETGDLQIDISSYANSQYSFFVEMVTYADAEGSAIASTKRGYTWSYDDLVSNGYVSSGGIGVPTYAAKSSVNMGSSVPEPTSGILLLVGGAMLALRRRRRA